MLGLFVTELSGRIKKPIEATLFGESLKAKVFRGGVWLGAGSFTEQIIRFGRNMLLARLLAPDAFGTMAIVLSVSSVIHTIMDIGVREALIQNPKGSEDEYVGSAWWIAFCRAVSFWAVLSLIAPLIAKFYGNPELSPLFRVSAVGVLFDGAMSSKAYVAIREMKFRKWATINHGGAILGIFVTLALSFFIRDVWALVIGYSAESVGRFILSYVICPYLPPGRLHRAQILDLLKFSKGAFGLSLLNLIFARTDIFVLAKLHSAAELGLYAMAIYVVQTPTGFIMNLLGQSLLPTFSKIQEDKPRVNRLLFKVTSALLFVGMPALVFTLFCGRSLLTLVYGYKYTAATGPLIVASFVAILNLVNGQITTIFYALGMPQLHRRCVALMAITMIILIHPFVEQFGFLGGQLACLLAIFIGFLFQVVRVRDITGLSLAQYGKVFLLSAGISVIFVIVCSGARVFGFLARPLPNILFGILGCVAAYGFSLGILLRSNRRPIKWGTQTEML